MAKLDCIVFVTHLETIAASLPTNSTKRLFFMFFTANTTFRRFKRVRYIGIFSFDSATKLHYFFKKKDFELKYHIYKLKNVEKHLFSIVHFATALSLTLSGKGRRDTYPGPPEGRGMKKEK